MRFRKRDEQELKKIGALIEKQFGIGDSQERRMFDQNGVKSLKNKRMGLFTTNNSPLASVEIGAKSEQFALPNNTMRNYSSSRLQQNNGSCELKNTRNNICTHSKSTTLRHSDNNLTLYKK